MFLFLFLGIVYFFKSPVRKIHESVVPVKYNIQGIFVMSGLRPRKISFLKRSIITVTPALLYKYFAASSLERDNISGPLSVIRIVFS